jgi:hypothetical protein
MTDVDDSKTSEVALHNLVRGLDCVLKRGLIFPRVQCIYTCSNNNTWLEIIRLMGPVGVASLLSTTTSLIYPHKNSSTVSCLTSDERDKENHIMRGLKITTPHPIKEYIQGILNMRDRMEVPAGCGGET